MYSAMCSLHWLCADGSQCSQFLQQCMSTPQCGHVSARWSFTSKTSSFLHLWQKCRFDSTFGIQPMGVKGLREQALASLDVAHHALVFDLPRPGALLHVLELAADLGVDRLVEVEVLLEHRAHAAPEIVVLDEDLIDVGRVHQHFDELIEQE